MDEFTKEKFRALGAIAVIILAILLLFFIFYHQREKKNIAMKLRLFFSDMTQTMQYSMNINGQPGEWDWHAGYKNADVINNYIASYLRVAENCVKTVGNCFPDSEYKNLSKDYTNVNLYKLPALKLQNGISLAFETISSCKKDRQICAVVYVDMNGIDPPNMFGKDLFVFTIINSSATAFLPYNLSVKSDNLTVDEKMGCNKSALLPMYCSALLYIKNWNIDSKYPW